MRRCKPMNGRAAVTASATVLLLTASNAALGAGFALLEQSSSRLGTAASGTAAAADDPTTLYFNPAGMMHLNGVQTAVSLSGIYITSEFSNKNSVAALGQSLGNAGGNAGGMNWVPSAYLTANFDDRWALGIAVNGPFGLKLEYDQGWMGRFQSDLSDIKTINVNPSIALRISDMLSIGAGANYQTIDAELTSAVNYSAIIAGGLQQLATAGTITPLQAAALTQANAGLQGRTVVTGDDEAWGFNVGVLFDFTENARLGVSYRSSVKYKVTGDVAFTRPTTPEPIGTGIVDSVSAPGGLYANGPVSVDLELPSSAIASFWARVTPSVELLADVQWTEWSSIPELRVLRASGETLQNTIENWDDTWRAAVGAAFTVNNTWKLRVGVAYDQTPVPDSTRTPRLPDPDRYWVAIGAGWSPTESVTVDFGYVHLFAEDVPLNQNAGNTQAYALINGEQSTAIDIATAQVVYRF